MPEKMLQSKKLIVNCWLVVAFELATTMVTVMGNVAVVATRLVAFTVTSITLALLTIVMGDRNPFAFSLPLITAVKV